MSPIKKENKGKYSKRWKEIVAQVAKRSGEQCECMGECGLHTKTGRCIEENRQQARYAKGMIVLTTAHLCHNEACEDMEHLRHMCQRCHLRYDSKHHQQSARMTRHRKHAAADLFLR